MRIQVIILILLSLDQREGVLNSIILIRSENLLTSLIFRLYRFGEEPVRSLIHCEIRWIYKPRILGRAEFCQPPEKMAP